MRKALSQSLLVASLTACSLSAQNPFKDMWNRMVNPDVEVTLVHPPALGLKVKKLAMAPAKSVEDEETIAAISSALSQTGQVELIDQRVVARVLAEQKIQAGGYLSQESVTQLAKLLGPSVLASVDIYRFKIEDTQGTKEYKTKKGYYLDYISKRKAVFSGSIRVIDLDSGKIFQSVPVSCEPYLENVSQEGYPEYPSETAVRSMCLNKASHEAIKLFTTWNEKRKLIFFDDKEYGMKEAYQSLEMGKVESAKKYSEDALQKAKNDPAVKPKYLGRANYNLGLCHMVDGNLESAISFIQAALDVDPKSSIYSESKAECLRIVELREKMQRVDDQTSLREMAAKEQAGAASKMASTKRESDPVAEKASAGSKKATGPEDRLKKLDQLLKKGLISKSDYQKKKEAILDEI